MNTPARENEHIHVNGRGRDTATPEPDLCMDLWHDAEALLHQLCAGDAARGLADAVKHAYA